VIERGRRAPDSSEDFFRMILITRYLHAARIATSPFPDAHESDFARKCTLVPPGV
jgi:hypothetical protein